VKIEAVIAPLSANSQESADPDGAIAISGGSGMLGTALRIHLARDGWPLIQLVREPARGRGQVRWNPAAQPAIEQVQTLEGCKAAIHLGGASLASRRWTPEYRRELQTSRIDSTRGLAMLLARLHRPPSILIVASAVGLYGNRGDAVVDECSPPGEGFLADLCRAWEEAAQPAREAGMRVVHTRFGVVLGQGQGALGKMVPLFRLGLGGRLGSGRQWMSWVSLEDAIAAILFALETPTLDGPVNVTAPHPVKNVDFTRALARIFHRPAILPAPAFALRVALGPMADEALLASTRAVPTRLVAAGFRFQHSSIEEALSATFPRL
jgi:uncharacterized protein